MRFINRTAENTLRELVDSYSVVTITGPRQSGKTTLCRMCFPKMDYVNLEAPDVRQFAIDDPRGFLARYPEGAVIDEIQRTPDLPSYIQVISDEPAFQGKFILTGSRDFRVREAVNQSLAGRTGILNLLPFSYDEIARIGSDTHIDQLLNRGGYPGIHHRKLDPVSALRDYTETYIERDVRQISMVQDLLLFQKFMGLCSGRTGQLLNYVGLSSDTGTALTTVKAWLSVLEAGYICFRLLPFHANISKRLVKSPKLYFYDTGLASYLMGINSLLQIPSHPLRGALFENYVVTEVMKYFQNRGKRPPISFYRDSNQNEVDIIIQKGSSLVPVEIKSAQTITGGFLKSIDSFRKATGSTAKGLLFYGGEETYTRENILITGAAGLETALDELA